MCLRIQAACGCHTGKIRTNNEDNFFFFGQQLDADSQGLADPLSFSGKLKSGTYLAVFDGIGGENFGEAAAFAAAQQMQTAQAHPFLCAYKRVLSKALQLNQAVVEKKRELRTDRCGTTTVMLYFSRHTVFSCNVGDSRAYQLRNKQLTQLSVDHLGNCPDNRKKAPLVQYLGMDPEDIQIQPSIAKASLRKGDTYLLCSDGLTDMLTESEIAHILQAGKDPANCVQKLIDSALERGGRDNITAIVCTIV